MSNLLRAPLIVLGFLAALLCVRADEPKRKPVPPEEALKRLQDGNARFVKDELATRPAFPAQRARTAKGQQPFAVVLTCADSRVVPELIFNQQLGDLFVVRVAGNVCDPVVLGSVEYAVEHFGSTLVVVLGHSQCGAVKAVIDKEEVKGNLLELAKRVQVGGDLPADKEKAVAQGVRNNVQAQAQEMTKSSTVLKDFSTSGRVRIVGAIYALDSGKVEWLK